METFQPNDIVYIREFGYCQLITCGRYRSIKLKRRESVDNVLTEPILRKQKESLCFDPDCFQFEYESDNTNNNNPDNPVPPESGVNVSAPPPAPAPPTNDDSSAATTADSSTTPQPEITRNQSIVAESNSSIREPNIVSAKLFKCPSTVTIYTPDFNLTKIIRVKVKVFLSQRQEFDIPVSISSSILQLKNKILEMLGEPVSNFQNPRLFCTQGGVLVECVNNKEFLYATKIRDHSKLVFLATLRFGLEPTLKGPSLSVTNTNKTLQRQTPADDQPQYEFVLGSTAIYSGKIYFEIKIDKAAEDEDVIVGFAKKTINPKVDPAVGLASEPFWGFMCLGAKKVGLEAADADPAKDYGQYCKTGDIVGVLIQVNPKTNQVSGSFYVNGKALGKAFTQVVEAPVWPAFCLNSGNIQITLNAGAQIPFDINNLK